jgi:hypothetical protein
LKKWNGLIQVMRGVPVVAIRILVKIMGVLAEA